MNGQRILFAVIGIVIGFIGGFILANSINRNAPPQTANLPIQPQNLPNNPQITAQMPDVVEAIDMAKNEPENFAAQLKVGDMYAQIGRFDKATEFFVSANRIKPDDYQTIVKLGNSYIEINNLPEAEKWYSKALEIKPDDVNVRSDLGLTFYKRQPPDLDRAVKEYNLALALDPHHEATLQNLTVAFWDKKDADAMQSTLEKLEKANPNNPVVPKLKQELEILRQK